MIHEVTNYNDCPFYCGEYNQCDHPEMIKLGWREDRSPPLNNIIPAFCQLKKESIEIKLKK